MKERKEMMISQAKPFYYGAIWMRLFMKILATVTLEHKKCRVIIEYDPTNEKVRVFKEDGEG